MHILIISTPNDSIRQENVKKQMTEQLHLSLIDHTWELIPAVMKKPAHTGIMESFKNCVRKAKENGWAAVMICEDDLNCLHPNALTSFIHNYEMEAKVDYPGALFLAGLYEGIVEDFPMNYPFKKVTGKVSGFHCIIIPGALYDTFIAAEPGYTIDHWISVRASINIYVAYPFLVMQQDNYYSYTMEKIMEYTKHIHHKYKLINHE